MFYCPGISEVKMLEWLFAVGTIHAYNIPLTSTSLSAHAITAEQMAIFALYH